MKPAEGVFSEIKRLTDKLVADLDAANHRIAVLEEQLQTKKEQWRASILQLTADKVDLRRALEKAEEKLRREYGV